MFAGDHVWSHCLRDFQLVRLNQLPIVGGFQSIGVPLVIILIFMGFSMTWTYMNHPAVRGWGYPDGQVLDSGFLATAPSLLIQLMADDSYVQVRSQKAKICTRWSISVQPYFEFTIFIRFHKLLRDSFGGCVLKCSESSRLCISQCRKQPRELGKNSACRQDSQVWSPKWGNRLEIWPLTSVCGFNDCSSNIIVILVVFGSCLKFETTSKDHL